MEIPAQLAHVKSRSVAIHTMSVDVGCRFFHCEVYLSPAWYTYTFLLSKLSVEVYSVLAYQFSGHN